MVAGAGADRLRLSDTVGMLDPAGYGDRVRLVREAADIDLQCHAHNDYGYATANTIAGLAAGARYFHTTINGIGERAGMADMAQVVLILQKFHGIDLGIDLTGLTALSRQLTEFLRLPVLPWQPIVGPNVFAHESGIHVNAMLRDTSTFEPFPPEEVGNARRYVLGKHSGRALVAHLLAERGIEPDEKALGATLVAVRRLAHERGGAVADAELEPLSRPSSLSELSRRRPRSRQSRSRRPGCRRARRRPRRRARPARAAGAAPAARRRLATAGSQPRAPTGRRRRPAGGAGAAARRGRRPACPAAGPRRARG